MCFDIKKHLLQNYFIGDSCFVDLKFAFVVGCGLQVVGYFD
jgi:hypothetical protein